MNKNIIAVIIGILVVGGGSFYAGTKVSKGNSNMPRTFSQDQISQFRGVQNGMGMQTRQGRMGTVGEIISKDDTSITIKLMDGGSRIIFVSPSTGINKTITGSTADLAIGENVVVMGTTNSDGSVSAQSIQIGAMVPSFR